MNKREFHVGDILSITDGRLVAPRGMDAIYDILNYVTSEELFTHQLPRAMKQCRPFLLRQHPQLASLVDPDAELNPDTVPAWLQNQVDKFGEMLPVEKLPFRDEPAPDPIEEAISIFGKEKVLVVEAKERKR